jgi:hypothetical protein
MLGSGPNSGRQYWRGHRTQRRRAKERTRAVDGRDASSGPHRVVSKPTSKLHHCGTHVLWSLEKVRVADGMQMSVSVLNFLAVFVFGSDPVSTASETHLQPCHSVRLDICVNTPLVSLPCLTHNNILHRTHTCIRDRRLPSSPPFQGLVVDHCWRYIQCVSIDWVHSGHSRI